MIKHYKIINSNSNKDLIFIDYEDALNYCDKNNLHYDCIIKTDKYTEGKKYIVINGIFEGTVFNGKIVNDRIINLNSVGQSFPVENCKEFK